jgi:hypothetical protein
MLGDGPHNDYNAFLTVLEPAADEARGPSSPPSG